MKSAAEDTDDLLRSVAEGDRSARSALLQRHRARLTAMVCLRMDRRLAARIDPSDVVQDVLIEAHRRLPDFARSRPLPFYPWLRSLAWERLIQLQRRHVHAQRRSIGREEQSFPLPEGSEAVIAERFVHSGSNAPSRAIRKEIQSRVRTALEKLPDVSREIIVLRHLEEVPFKEIEAVLGLSEAAVYSRYRRALEALSRVLQAVDD